MAQEREAAPPNSWRITWPCSTKRERACSDERDGSTATAETAAQQQRKKTLIEAEAAEIQRKKEQIAKADADNAYRNSIGLSPEQFIQLEQIKRYSEACAKSTCIIGSVPVVVGGK